VNLDTLASYAEIIGLITILGAAVYSWFQIGNHLLVNRLGSECTGGLNTHCTSP